MIDDEKERSADTRIGDAGDSGAGSGMAIGAERASVGDAGAAGENIDSDGGVGAEVESGADPEGGRASVAHASAAGDASARAAGDAAEGGGFDSDFMEEDRSESDPRLVIDVDGFEGPLDLLLELARRQKVDLAKISILALAEQYLAFIERVRNMRIEIAADYLVMAAWLAWLKSRLLLPSPGEGDSLMSGEEATALLAFRLRRLEAMRRAGRRLIQRDRLGQHFFARGEPQPIIVEKSRSLDASLYDLLTAYGAIRRRGERAELRISRRKGWSLMQAREILIRLLGPSRDWVEFEALLSEHPRFRQGGRDRNEFSFVSSFAAILELAREGKARIRQEGAWKPVWVKGARGGRNG